MKKNKFVASFAILGLLVPSMMPFSAFAASVSIFSDDFEANNFNKWTTHESKWATFSSGALSGSRSAKVAGNTSGDKLLVKNISTATYENLNLSFSYRVTQALEASDHVYVEWTQNGTSWNTIADYTNLSAGGILSASLDLSSDANDKSNFGFRFRANLNGSSDVFRIDEVSLTGTKINTAPVANDDSLLTDEDTESSSFVLAIDSDIPTQDIVYSVVSDPEHGVLTSFDPATGGFTYSPAENYNGPDSFKFKGSDGVLFSNEATVSIIVNPVNDAPSLDTLSDVTADEESSISFTAHAVDVDGDSIVYSLLGAPAGATIDSSTGVFSWVTTENDGPGSYPFTVTATDAHGLFASQSITAVVNEVNTVPVAHDISKTAPASHMNDSVDIELSASDDDFPENVLTYSIVSDPSTGTLGAISGNHVLYTPALNDVGTYTFTYKVNDGTADSNVATVTIAVDNDVPTLSEISDKTVNEEAELSFIAVASDPSDDLLTFSLGEGSPAGTSIDSSTGVFSFTPTEAQGPASYDVIIEVTDGNARDSQVFKVDVTEVNKAPVAENISVTTNEDTASNITFLSSDVDVPLQTLSYSIVSESGPIHGTLGEISGNTVAYTPNLNYNGTDSFQYVANDGVVDSAPVTVSITVNAVNDAPVITILGDNPMGVKVEGEYVEMGAEVTDVDYVGTITAEISGTVDTLRLGGHLITYTATDGELTTTAVRFVNVFEILAGASVGSGDLLGTTLYTPSSSGNNPAPETAPATTTMLVSWETANPSYGHVIYGIDTGTPYVIDLTKPNYGYPLSTPSDPSVEGHLDIGEKVTHHNFTLTDLVSGATYRYRTLSHASPAVIDEEGTFTAPPAVTEAPVVIGQSGAVKDKDIVVEKKEVTPAVTENTVPASEENNTPAPQTTSSPVKTTAVAGEGEKELMLASSTEGKETKDDSSLAAVGSTSRIPMIAWGALAIFIAGLWFGFVRKGKKA